MTPAPDRLLRNAQRTKSRSRREIFVLEDLRDAVVEDAGQIDCLAQRGMGILPVRLRLKPQMSIANNAGRDAQATRVHRSLFCFRLHAIDRHFARSPERRSL